MENGDFLSHDFMEDFPLDPSEPDDSLVQVWVMSAGIKASGLYYKITTAS